MSTSKMLFVGIRGMVLALDKATGEPIWTRELKGSEFVTVIFENERLFAATKGEVYCLEAASGSVLWKNPLKGFGTGLVTLTTATIASNPELPAVAEKRRREQAAAAAAAGGAAAGAGGA